MVIKHGLEDPPACQDPVWAGFHAEAAPDAMTLVNSRFPSLRGFDYIDCPGSRAGHHAEQCMGTGLAGEFRKSPEVRRRDQRRCFYKEKFSDPFQPDNFTEIGK